MHPSRRNRRLKKTDSYSSPSPESRNHSPVLSMYLDWQMTKKTRIHETGLMKFWTGEWNMDPQFFLLLYQVVPKILSNFR
jgi:hypothetical protein